MIWSLDRDKHRLALNHHVGIAIGNSNIGGVVRITAFADNFGNYYRLESCACTVLGKNLFILLCN